MKKKKGPLILTGVLVILLIVYFGLSSWNKKQDKKEAAKVKSKPETAEQKLERVRKQATEHGYPKNVIELLDKNVETVCGFQFLPFS